MSIEFKTAIKLSKSVLYVPCHQLLKKEDLDVIIASIDSVPPTEGEVK